MNRRDQIEEANHKVLELEGRKQAIQEQLDAWIRVRDSLVIIEKADASEPLIPAKIGPTAAIKVILGKNPKGLTPLQIAEELKSYGVAMGKEKNFLINIHSIIKRNKNIEDFGEGGQTFYRLKPR